LVAQGRQNVCHVCFPQECDLFLKGACKGRMSEGEFAVAKASLRILEELKKEAKP
jgi:hypothetical protein